MVAATTAFGSEAAMSLAGTCGACGHQTSLHRQTAAQRWQEGASKRQEEADDLARRRADAQATFREAKLAQTQIAPAVAVPTPISDEVREINEMLARASARARKGTTPKPVATTADPETLEKVLPPPGFYSDPKPDPSQLRWWDGKEWTAFTKPKE